MSGKTAAAYANSEEGQIESSLLLFVAGRKLPFRE